MLFYFATSLRQSYSGMLELQNYTAASFKTKKYHKDSDKNNVHAIKVNKNNSIY